MTVKEMFEELTAFTQLYLRQEYEQGWLTVDKTSYDHFKELAKKCKNDPSKKLASPQYNSPFVQNACKNENKEIIKQKVEESPITHETQNDNGRNEKIVNIPAEIADKREKILQHENNATKEDEEKAKPQKNEEKIFTLATQLSSPVDIELSDIRKSLLKCRPQLKLYDDIPDDSFAKKQANLWLEHRDPVVTILITKTIDNQQRALTENLTRAITISLVPAKIIYLDHFDSEKKCNDLLENAKLKLIIGKPNEIKTHFHMHYKQDIATQASFLSNIPILPFDDLSNYEKNPQLKAELWKAIKILINQR